MHTDTFTTSKTSSRPGAAATLGLAFLIAVMGTSACDRSAQPPAPAAEPPAPAVAPATVAMTDAELETLVRRSYAYVAMYNVNNKFALSQGGWNLCVADTTLKDHTMTDIARPNNDTLYDSCLLDLREDAIALEIPAFDSDYVSLMVTAYDHHVNIPLTTRLGDFEEPTTILLYSERTKGYDGAPVEGIERTFEATGDFVSAVFRVMPHQSEPERLAGNIESMQAIKAVPLAEFRGGPAAPAAAVEFPAVGATDADVFATNLLEVMQFIFNHTTFHDGDEMDQAVLSAYKPLGVEPGLAWDPEAVAKLDGERLRAMALQIQKERLAMMSDEEKQAEMQPYMFQPKGESNFETILTVSVIGPIGLPREEALYPALTTVDGASLNAMNDYVIRMSKEEMPPANAFWSLTLYDLENGFFIPNDRKKYSVGENGGMKLDDDGGIAIYIAAEKPAGVPEENWLPISRGDIDLSGVFRLYEPDLEKYETWRIPKAEKLASP